MCILTCIDKRGSGRTSGASPSLVVDSATITVTAVAARCVFLRVLRDAAVVWLQSGQYRVQLGLEVCVLCRDRGLQRCKVANARRRRRAGVVGAGWDVEAWCVDAQKNERERSLVEKHHGLAFAFIVVRVSMF